MRFISHLKMERGAEMDAKTFKKMLWAYKYIWSLNSSSIGSRSEEIRSEELKLVTLNNYTNNKLNYLGLILAARPAATEVLAIAERSTRIIFE